MNSRERILLGVLLAVLGVGGVGALFYFGFYKDYADADLQLTTEETELKKKQDELQKLQDEQKRLYALNPRMKDWKLYSLPDVSGKRTPDTVKKHTDDLVMDYQRYLNTLLLTHGFNFSSIKISPKPPDTKTGVTPQNKTPVFVKLQYSVQGSATYASVINTLKAFYSDPLLQEVRSLTLTRPQTVRDNGNQAGPGGRPGGGIPIVPPGVPGFAPPRIGGNAPPGPMAFPPLGENPMVAEGVGAEGQPPEGPGPGVQPPQAGRGGRGGNQRSAEQLDVSMTIEVLIVTGTPYRTTVMPEISSGTHVPSDLASSERKYNPDMLARNPFYPLGIQGPTGDRGVASRKEAIQVVLEHVKLTMIAYDGRRWKATFYDQGLGGNEIPVNAVTLPSLTINDMYENKVFEGKVVHLDAGLVVIEADKKYIKDDKRKYLVLHIGDTLYEPFKSPMTEKEYKEIIEKSNVAVALPE